jgi:hypothetical protein
VNRRWVLACALAETIGMAASAGAARAAGSRPAATGFVIVLLGGLVEGTALGILQARVLFPRLGRVRARGWALVTLLFAGIGWAAGSAPSTLSGDSGAAPPPMGLILTGAVAMGLVLGALLGAAQAAVLVHRVHHPWRWIAANSAGWAVAMPLVFVGATTAGAGWPWPVLVLWGAMTGCAAGACLGLVTGLWLPALDGLPVRHRATLWWLTRRARPAQSGWTGLSVAGRQSRHQYRFPVMSAPLGRRSLVVLPGHPERKSWWHNLSPDGAVEVAVLDEGTWAPARGRLLEHGSMEWSVARSAYVARWPRVDVGAGPLVVVDLQRPRDQGPVVVGPDAMAAPLP